MTRDDRRKARAASVAHLRPISAAALPVALMRISLGTAWLETPEAHASLLELVVGIEALDGYLCKAGRN